MLVYQGVTYRWHEFMLDSPSKKRWSADHTPPLWIMTQHGGYTGQPTGLVDNFVVVLAKGMTQCSSAPQRKEHAVVRSTVIHKWCFLGVPLSQFFGDCTIYIYTYIIYYHISIQRRNTFPSEASKKIAHQFFKSFPNHGDSNRWIGQGHLGTNRWVTFTVLARTLGWSSKYTIVDIAWVILIIINNGVIL